MNEISVVAEHILKIEEPDNATIVKNEVKSENDDEEELEPPAAVFLDEIKVKMEEESEDSLAMDGEDFSAASGKIDEGLLFPDKEEPPENELLSAGVVARQQRNDNFLEIQEMPVQKAMDRKLVKCLVCKKSVGSKQAFDCHMESHSGEKPFESSTCQKRLSHKQTLAMHLRKHSSENPFECTVCKKRFPVKNCLNRHLLTHPGTKLHRCPVCKEDFLQKALFREHIQTHTGGKLFECSLCKKNFTSRSWLIYHERTHRKEDVFWCSICPERFGKKELLDEHKLIHASEKPSKSPKLVFDRFLVPVSLDQ